jgi:hypothetical protein
MEDINFIIKVKKLGGTVLIIYKIKNPKEFVKSQISWGFIILIFNNKKYV